MSEGKAREFYVSEIDYVYYDEGPPLGNCGYVHVIEYKAVTELEEKVKELEGELDILKIELIGRKNHKDIMLNRAVSNDNKLTKERDLALAQCEKLSECIKFELDDHLVEMFGENTAGGIELRARVNQGKKALADYEKFKGGE